MWNGKGKLKKKAKKAIGKAIGRSVKSAMRSQSRNRADLPSGFASEAPSSRFSVSTKINLGGAKKKRQLKKIKKWQRD